MQNRTFHLFLTLFLSLQLVTLAKADFVLDFSTDDGLTFSNDFGVLVGDSIDIGIYLRDNSPADVLTMQGLSSWGFDLTRSSTSLGTISSLATNPIFDMESHNVTSEERFEWEYFESVGLGVTGESILLGSFEFLAAGEGTTEFTISDRLPGTGLGNASWLTPGLIELDELVFGTEAAGTYQFTVNSVSAVPEPSSLVLLSCVAGLSLFRRRRVLN